MVLPSGGATTETKTKVIQMSDYRARAMQEHSELNQKIEKLKGFIVGEAYDELPEVDRKDLKAQLGHMEGYFSVLNRRVSRMCNNA